MFSDAELDTPRLRLVPISPAIVRAFFDDRNELSRLIGASIPTDWPVDPIIMQILSKRLDEPTAFEWADHIYVLKDENRVIGDGGFKGPPHAEGCVEIGYGIIPKYRCKGLATEGARALLERAFSDPAVKSVLAETATGGFASMAVLRKFGMTQYGNGHNDEDDDLLCWRITRHEHDCFLDHI